MKLWVAAGAALIGSFAHAQPSAQAQWFTVAGNPADAAADTVQVNPVALGSDGTLKMMNVRVSRSTLRRNWEGVPYRSYEAEVAFDCRAWRADYRVATFYMEPLWQGPPQLTTDYAKDPKPMRFMDMAPNPTSRIIRAACRLRNG